MELIEKILSDENISEAIKRVKSNKGAPGVDKMTVNEIDKYFDEHKGKIKKSIMTMEQNEPLLREAYTKLGADKVKALRYTKKSIQDALICLGNTEDAEQKVARIIVKTIQAGQPITVAKANQIITDAYTKVGIKHTARAKDLHKWFECSDPISKRVNGKVVKCVDIYRAKYIFKDEAK